MPHISPWFDVDGNPQTDIVCWETFGEVEPLFDIGGLEQLALGRSD